MTATVAKRVVEQYRVRCDYPACVEADQRTQPWSQDEARAQSNADHHNRYYHGRAHQ